MDKITKIFGFDKIKETVNSSDSFVEVTKKLGYDPNVGHIRKNIERIIKRLNISTEHFKSVQRIKESKTRYTKEKLEILVKKCKTYKEILENLDILPITTNYNRLKSYLIKFEIDFNHLKNHQQSVKNIWLKENLEVTIKECNTQSDVLKKLGIRDAGGNFGTLRKYIKLYNLDTSHFIKNYYVISKFSESRKIPLEKILIENSTYGCNKLKERLYKEKIKERICELCGQDEYWKGKKMSLILDHKNGIHNDNRPENLQIVCPNCNSTLPTHCRKNKLSNNINI